MSRLVNCPCGRTVMVCLHAVFPIECLCGLDYDPRTGEPLPVCEGFELLADVSQSESRRGG